MRKRSRTLTSIIAALGFFLAFAIGALALLTQVGVQPSFFTLLYQLLQHLSFASDGSPWGLIPLALTFAGASAMVLAIKSGKRRFLLLLPLLVVMSYTLYTLSHLVTLSVQPALGAWLLERSSDIRAASLKVVVLFMAEMVLFVAIVLIGDAIAYATVAHHRRKRRRARAKLEKEQAEEAASTPRKRRKKRREKPETEQEIAIQEAAEAAEEPSVFSVVDIPELESFESRPKSVQVEPTVEVAKAKTIRDAAAEPRVVSVGALHALNAERLRSQRDTDSPAPKRAGAAAEANPKDEELSGFLVGALEAIGKPTKKRRKGTMKLPQGRARGILAEAVEREELTRTTPLSEPKSELFASLQQHEAVTEAADPEEIAPVAAAESEQAAPAHPPVVPVVASPVSSTTIAAGEQSTGKSPSIERRRPIVEPSHLPANAPEVQSEAAEAEDDFETEFEAKSGVGGLVQSEGKSALLNQGRIRYQYPSESILETYEKIGDVVDDATRARGELLVETLAEFNITVELKAIVRGPTVTMFELLPTAGIRVNAIANLSDNIALALAATQVRIVAPIPGKSAVGVEIPNIQRDIIGFREMLNFISHKFKVPMILGRDLLNRGVAIDVMESPHLLIAGSTGSGKSVCINSLICSILYTRSSREVRMILVDPKIVELNVYNGIPHLLTPVITDSKRAIKALDFALYEMDRRYRLLQSISVRNIVGYNERIKEQRIARQQLPYIVIVIDEFADLMHQLGKEMEMRVSRLAAMSRAVGIHLVLATQRPSVDVITGVIKNNIPTRIAFAVTSSTNSRIILDEMGAEQLLGRGDMLYQSASDPAPTRLQGSFLSDREVEEIVDFVRAQGEPDYIDESFFEDQPEPSASESEGSDADLSDDEVLFEEALAIIIERNGASASFLQRRLKIGYNRAARLVEQMEEMGIVGPPNGSKPRELLRIP
ncbi:MAG TPA: DNA translocase FtsK [Sphaerochaeta sp.]|nr:DNA translocase FtsK [Sphaerochaeta sp.]